MRRLVWLLAVVLITNGTLAQDLTTERQSLLACYGAEALIRGSQSCNPPPTLVDAVFGKCLAEEQALKHALLRLEPGNSVFAENGIKHVRARMARGIQSIILDSQTSAGNCP
jgi:hypothetical protein